MEHAVRRLRRRDVAPRPRRGQGLGHRLRPCRGLRNPARGHGRVPDHRRAQRPRLRGGLPHLREARRHRGRPGVARRPARRERRFAQDAVLGARRAREDRGGQVAGWRRDPPRVAAPDPVVHSRQVNRPRARLGELRLLRLARRPAGDQRPAPRRHRRPQRHSRHLQRAAERPRHARPLQPVRRLRALRPRGGRAVRTLRALRGHLQARPPRRRPSAGQAA